MNLLSIDTAYDCSNLFPVEYVQSPSKFFAKCLYFSLKGFRSDNDALTRIIVSRSEIDLGDIKSEFEWLYDRKLARSINVTHQHHAFHFG